MQTADMNGTLVRIQECSACGASHESVALTEYQKKVGPFTHWYVCPTLGDPCQVALLSLSGENGIELSGPICQALIEAQLAGRYMVAVWFIDQEGKLRLKRKDNRFPHTDMLPHGEHPGALGMLKEQLEAECGQQQPQVMRTAETPKPLRNLLGAGQPNGNQQRIKIPQEAFRQAANIEAGEQAEANGADSEPAG